MSKKTAILIFFLLSAIPAHAVTTDWKPYFPTETAQEWNYKFFSKKENKQKDDIQAYMKKTEEYDGVEYYVYEVPSRRMYYYLAKDDKGVYVKAAKVCLPFLEFINMDISFNPSVCVLKFPFVKGEQWRYDGIARVHVFAVIDIGKTLTVRFKMYGPEFLNVNGKKTRVFHLFALANRRWEDEKPLSADAWFGKYTGVVRAETRNSLLEIK